MDDQVIAVNYLAEPGPQNTEITLAAALKRSIELGLKHVVVATDSGKTARKAHAVFGAVEGCEVVAVTNSDKLRLPISKLHDYTERFQAFRDELKSNGIEAVPVGMTDEAIEKLQDEGVVASRIDWKEFTRFVRQDVNSLDVIGVAVRVALTCAVWANINGDIPDDVDVMALAGTGFGGGGADTAIVVRTAKKWKDYRILETIIRPRESPPSMLNR